MRTKISVVVAMACGCEATAQPPVAKPNSISVLVDKVRAAQTRMHQRFEATSRMQVAIGIGDLGRAHDEARVVEALDEPELLPEWRPYISNIREAARQVVATNDTVTAAKSAARLGRACAQCHEASAARVVFPTEAAPADGPKLSTQMFSHQWAALRMWEGLIGPDDRRWLQGARMLGDARVAIAAETGLGLADDVSRVRMFAAHAQEPRSQSSRMEIYGELLGTCAHCHFVIRDTASRHE